MFESVVWWLHRVAKVFTEYAVFGVLHILKAY